MPTSQTLMHNKGNNSQILADTKFDLWFQACIDDIYLTAINVRKSWNQLCSLSRIKYNSNSTCITQPNNAVCYYWPCITKPQNIIITPKLDLYFTSTSESFSLSSKLESVSDIAVLNTAIKIIYSDEQFSFEHVFISKHCNLSTTDYRSPPSHLSKEYVAPQCGHH